MLEYNIKPYNYNNTTQVQVGVLYRAIQRLVKFVSYSYMYDINIVLFAVPSSCLDSRQNFFGIWRTAGLLMNVFQIKGL